MTIQEMPQGHLKRNSRVVGVKWLPYFKETEFDEFSGFLKHNLFCDFLTLQEEYDKSSKVLSLLPCLSSFQEKKNLGQI